MLRSFLRSFSSMNYCEREIKGIAVNIIACSLCAVACWTLVIHLPEQRGLVILTNLGVLAKSMVGHTLFRLMEWRENDQLCTWVFQKVVSPQTPKQDTRWTDAGCLKVLRSPWSGGGRIAYCSCAMYQTREATSKWSRPGSGFVFDYRQMSERLQQRAFPAPVDVLRKLRGEIRKRLVEDKQSEKSEIILDEHDSFMEKMVSSLHIPYLL